MPKVLVALDESELSVQVARVAKRLYAGPDTQLLAISVATVTTSQAIVRAIVQIAESFGLDTVAEGVEDIEEWSNLRSLGCARAQGYFFARPVSTDDAERVLDGVAETLDEGALAAVHPN